MNTYVTDYKQVSVRVKEVLQNAFGPNAALRTDEAYQGRVFVRIVSDKFDSLSEREKQERIWKVLKDEMGPEAQSVSLVLAFGTDQV